MFARAEPWETQKTTLAADDEAALRALYPAPRTSASTLAAPASAAAESTSGDAGSDAVDPAAAPEPNAEPQPPQIKIRSACSQSASTTSPVAPLAFLIFVAGALLRRRASRAVAALVLPAALLLPAVSEATMVHALTIDDLTVRATDIVEGTVIEQTSRQAGRFVVTDVVVRVDVCHKGECSASEVIVQVFGGLLGDYVVSAAGAATYDVGEQVLLFLEPVAAVEGVGELRLRTPGLALGKFRIALAGDLPAVERNLHGLELLGPARTEAEAESHFTLADLRARIATLLSP
jgi:hypothetical protein